MFNLINLSSYNFSWLARIATPRKTSLSGLLPPLATLAALMTMAFMISGAIWTWGVMQATAGLFLPLYVTTLAAVCGVTALNFLFNREIQTFMFSTREVRENFIFSKENPTDLRKMVTHLCAEMNVYYRRKYGDQHIDMPVPRLLTFSEPHFEFHTVEGINPWNSAIIMSSGFFNYHDTNMNQRHLAAVLSAQLAKIYMRRGTTHTLVKMGVDLLNTLENFRHLNAFTNLLGIFTWPLEFVLLYERAIRRACEYEAATVVTELGRGMDYGDALNKKVCPTLWKQPTLHELNQDKANKMRPPYNGPFRFVLGPIVDSLKKNFELPEDHKASSLGWVILAGFVREGGYFLRELWSASPRSTNLRAHMRDFTQEDRAINTAALKELRNQDKEKNRTFYSEIPEADRYDIIGPDGRGKATWDKRRGEILPLPKGQHSGHHHGYSVRPITPQFNQQGVSTDEAEEKNSIGQRVHRRRVSSPRHVH